MRLPHLALCLATLALAPVPALGQAPQTAPQTTPQTAPEPASQDDRAPAAMAEESFDPESEQAAKGLFQAGGLAFRQGRYDDAYNHFREAYLLVKKPLLLFNMASCLDRLRRDADAVEAFEAYVAAAPNAPNRSAVEARIKLLKAAVEREEERQRQAAAAQAQQAQQPAPSAQPLGPAQPQPPPDQGDGGGLSPVFFWVGVGLTAAAGIGTLVSHLDTSSKLDDYEATPTRQLYEDGTGAETRTNVLLGVTVGLAVVSAVLGVVTFGGGSGEVEASAQASTAVPSVWASADGAGATLRGRF